MKKAVVSILASAAFLSFVFPALSEEEAKAKGARPVYPQFVPLKPAPIAPQPLKPPLTPKLLSFPKIPARVTLKPILPLPAPVKALSSAIPSPRTVQPKVSAPVLSTTFFAVPTTAVSGQPQKKTSALFAKFSKFFSKKTTSG